MTEGVMAEDAVTVRAIAEDPFEVLVGRILDGTLPASPEGIALVGWVCEFVATQPHFAALYATEGMLLGQHSDDAGANVLLGSVGAFLAELRRVCLASGLTEAQAKTVTDRARSRLG